MRKLSASNMAKIEFTVEINAPIDKVWEVVSDIDNEPKFWKGTKSVRNISKEGNVVNREITIAFKDKKCLQEVTLYPKEKIHALFTKGIIVGTKTISLTPQEGGNKTRSNLGYQTIRNDGNVYWNSKKTYSEWNGASPTKYQRKFRGIILWVWA